MTWEYIAGFFDGEGWIQKYNKPAHCLAKYGIGIGQSTCQDQVLYEISNFLKTQGVKCRMCTESKVPNRTQMTRLKIYDSVSIVNFLTQVIPYLLVKHAKSASALEDAKRCVARLQNRDERVTQAVKMHLSGESLWEIQKKTNVRITAIKRRLSMTAQLN